MKPHFLFAACVLASFAAAQNVSIPWDEFKTLYRDRIEKEVLMQTAPPAPRPQVHSIDEARYRIAVAGGEARGDVLIVGKVISGDPAPIPLFGDTLVLTEVTEVRGGALVSSGTPGGASFLPEAGAVEFQLVLGFLAPIQDDQEARMLSFAIPRALRNSLHLALPDETRILDHPGLRDPDGSFHFAAAPDLTVRFLDRSGIGDAGIVEIDAVSRIRMDIDRVFIETYFHPVRTLPESVVLEMPPGSVFISTSLQSSRVRTLDPARIELAMAPNDTSAFQVEVALDALGEDGVVSVHLPAIEGNSGRQERFVVDEPEHGQLRVDANGLVAQLPVDRLGDALRSLVAPSSHYMTVSKGEPIQLTIRRFQPVETPALVLDAQYFFATFDDNGTVLSTLVMDVPAEAGSRLRVAAVPEAEIWSLTVNGAKATVYRDESNMWIVPLLPGQPSHIELAFLRHGPPLGLQGTVEATVPATGLPARNLRMAIALPPRIELLVLDGPVAAASAESWSAPAELSGSRYSFSQSFYKGDGLTVAASYKEPINQK